MKLSPLAFARPFSLILAAVAASSCGLQELNEDTRVPGQPHPVVDLPQVDARVAIVFDRSGSFVQNLPAAIKVVRRYLQDNGISGTAEVLLIGMGHHPEFMKRYRAGAFVDRQGRAMLEALQKPEEGTGTNVVGSLDLAMRRLHEDSVSRAVQHFCLVFSDMQVDPSKSASGITNYPSLDEMDWGQFKGTSTSFYFIDPGLHDKLLGYGTRTGQTFRIFEPNDVESKDVKHATEVK